MACQGGRAATIQIQEGRHQPRVSSRWHVVYFNLSWSMHTTLFKLSRYIYSSHTNSQTDPSFTRSWLADKCPQIKRISHDQEHAQQSATNLREFEATEPTCSARKVVEGQTDLAGEHPHLRHAAALWHRAAGSNPGGAHGALRTCLPCNCKGGANGARRRRLGKAQATAHKAEVGKSSGDANLQQGTHQLCTWAYRGCRALPRVPPPRAPLPHAQVPADAETPFVNRRRALAGCHVQNTRGYGSGSEQGNMEARRQAYRRRAQALAVCRSSDHQVAYVCWLRRKRAASCCLLSRRLVHAHLIRLRGAQYRLSVMPKQRHEDAPARHADTPSAHLPIPSSQRVHARTYLSS